MSSGVPGGMNTISRKDSTIGGHLLGGTATELNKSVNFSETGHNQTMADKGRTKITPSVG